MSEHGFYLVAAERVLLGGSRPLPPGLAAVSTVPHHRSRIAALLARTAVELMVEKRLLQAELIQPGDRLTQRSQLTLARTLLPDAQMPQPSDLTWGRRADYVWSALSSACHQHAYDLAPTAAEVRHWVGQVRLLGAEV